MKTMTTRFIKHVKKNPLIVTPLIIIALYLIIAAITYAKYIALPSPLFGGDMYYQLGAIHHIMAGGNPLASSALVGELPGYSPLFAILGGIFGVILGSALSGQVLLAFFGLAASYIVFYLLIYRLFGDHLVAAIGIAAIGTPKLLHYTTFTQYFMFPLALLLLYELHMRLTKNSINWPLAAGSVALTGLLSITHTVAFIIVSGIIGLLILHHALRRWPQIHGMFFTANKERKKKSRSDANKKQVYSSSTFTTFFWSVFLAIHIAIGLLLYWWKPVFIYGGHTPNPYLEWNAFNFFDIGAGISWFFKYPVTFLVSFSTWDRALISLLVITGIASLFIWKAPGKKAWIIISTIIAYLATLHFIITIPLIGTHFYPERFYSFVGVYARIVIACAGGMLIGDIVRRTGKPFVRSITLIVIAGLLVTAGMQEHLRSNYESQWGKNAFSPVDADIELAASYLRNNAPVDTVILTNNELGFALNALSGRKLVSTRRAQNGAFVDMDRRSIDAAIMLYGNDSAEINRLMEHYDVQYLYWNHGWVHYDYYLGEDGEVISHRDPFLAFDTPENRQRLKRYNITYAAQHTWVDPALRGDNFATLDVLLIIPTFRDNLFEGFVPVPDGTLDETSVLYVKDEQD